MLQLHLPQLLCAACLCCALICDVCLLLQVIHLSRLLGNRPACGMTNTPAVALSVGGVGILTRADAFNNVLLLYG
jgi:hypothetical protein